MLWNWRGSWMLLHGRDMRIDACAGVRFEDADVDVLIRRELLFYITKPAGATVANAQ